MGAVAGFVIGLVVLPGPRALLLPAHARRRPARSGRSSHGWQSLTGGTNGTNGIFAADWINAFQHPDQLYWFIFGIVLLCTRGRST